MSLNVKLFEDLPKLPSQAKATAVFAICLVTYGLYSFTTRKSPNMVSIQRHGSVTNTTNRPCSTLKQPVSTTTVRPSSAETIALTTTTPTTTHPSTTTKKSTSTPPIKSTINETLSGVKFRSEDLDHTQFIFYNRVPKCGSETMIGLINKLAKRNHFKYALESLKFKPTSFYKYETEEQMQRFINRMLSYKPPVIFSRHLYFIDFTRYRSDVFPTYINLVRDPLQRQISVFNYRRFRRDRPHRLPLQQRFVTIDECVQNNHPECREELQVFLAFFCGLDPVCRNISSSTLKKAKQNIEKYYAVVGVLEQLEEFLFTLEGVLPRFFSGALDLYEIQVNKSKAKKNKTRRRSKPTERTKSILREKLKLEYDLYGFIQQRFHTQLQLLKRHMKVQDK